MVWRGRLGAVFFITILLFGLVVAWVVARFAMPRKEYVDIGLLSDYPPSTQPFEIRDPIHVFVVNDQGGLIVLDPLNRMPGGYLVRWNSIEGYFIDPSRGSWFDLLGRPVTHPDINGWRERQGLLHYPITIQDDHILVEVTQRLIPTARSDGQP